VKSISRIRTRSTYGALARFTRRLDGVIAHDVVLGRSLTREDA
jgi:hypothetical protein